MLRLCSFFLMVSSSLFAYQGRGLKDEKTRLARRMITALDQVIWNSIPDGPSKALMHMKREMLQLQLLVSKNYGDQILKALERAQADEQMKKTSAERGEWHSSFRRELIGLLQLEIAQTAVPDKTFGEKLYKEHCASCHGLKGDGKGPLASKLPVHPKDWTKKDLQEDTSASMIYHYLLAPPDKDLAAAFSGTFVMPSFLDILGADEMWAVSFYWKSLSSSQSVLTSKDLQMALPSSGLSLQEIASFSDRDLTKRFPSLLNQIRVVESFSLQTSRKVYR